MIYKLLILTALNLLLYWRTLKFEGVCDDIVIFKAKVEKPKSRFSWSKHPIKILKYVFVIKIPHQAGSLIKSKLLWVWCHVRGYKYFNFKFAHALTLSLHTVNSLLVYIAFGASDVSFLAALLFSVNPALNQGSCWISGRYYSINLMFALLSWWQPLLAVPLYLVGTYYFGPSLMFFPLVFLLTIHYKVLALLCVVGLLRELKYIFNKGDAAPQLYGKETKFVMESNAELLAIRPRKLIIALKTYGYYLTDCLIPHTLGFYHEFLFCHGVSKKDNKEAYRIDRYFWVGLLAACALLAGLVFGYRWGDTSWVFGLWWFSVNIAQWLNCITLNQSLALRYVYIPSAGLMLALAQGIYSIGKLWH